MNHLSQALEFDKILETLSSFALSEKAKEEIRRLTPSLSETTCHRMMAETTSARTILNACGAPPLPLMENLTEILHQCERGAMLTPSDLIRVATFCASSKRMISYLKRGESLGEAIATFGRNLEDVSLLQEEIESSVNEDKVYDEASSLLRNVRRKQEHLESQIKDKLAHILKSRKEYLADAVITKRNGHYVLPVKRNCQGQFGGSVIEVSGKGSTVFMEPTAISNLQAQLTDLSIEEDGEVRRILYTLSASVSEFLHELRNNMEILELLDVLFAKAKYSQALGARAVTLHTKRHIEIHKGRHPMLSPEECVPLDFVMDENTRGIIITGPNTGGKTVTLKTVGLLSMMAQSGLHIPCDEGSVIALHDGYFCDIGDSQNITQNLSTFSGHITTVIEILQNTSRDSLVILDELGSGTDPTEGMGIAIAVLEELKARGCQFLVTTHYPQVKTFAEETDGIQSASMAFDRESLKPLYRLELGKSGESCALHIAKTLGLSSHLLSRANEVVYGTKQEHASISSTTLPPTSKLQRYVEPKKTTDLSKKFTMGDSVIILATNETGIVYRPADDKGDVVVQVKGEKKRFKHNRIKLHVSAAELYPPDYDFSIIFDSVENRKARRILGKRYDPSVSITTEADEFS